MIKISFLASGWRVVFRAVGPGHSSRRATSVPTVPNPLARAPRARPPPPPAARVEASSLSSRVEVFCVASKAPACHRSRRHLREGERSILVRRLGLLLRLLQRVRPAQFVHSDGKGTDDTGGAQPGDGVDQHPIVGNVDLLEHAHE